MITFKSLSKYTQESNAGRQPEITLNLNKNSRVQGVNFPLLSGLFRTITKLYNLIKTIGDNRIN